MFYLGIDQHAKQLTINLRDLSGDVVLRRQVSTEPERVLAFFEGITRRCAEADCSFWAIVEVCGLKDWLLGTVAEVEDLAKETAQIGR